MANRRSLITQPQLPVAQYNILLRPLSPWINRSLKLYPGSLRFFLFIAAICDWIHSNTTTMLSTGASLVGSLSISGNTGYIIVLSSSYNTSKDAARVKLLSMNGLAWH
ncbi:hypothetical protein F5Y04DRAFT_256523 [Hypomontagnella monticulosa]|nr:hypothetical protein F5Y04DRAFT_256523 [Hypomontagnella monticulosa]